MKKWIVGASILCVTSYIVYRYKIKPNQCLDTLLILTDKKILEIFSRIKAAYKTSFTKHQAQFRIARRKLTSNSKEYLAQVSDFYTSLPSLLNEVIDDVLQEFEITRTIFDNSWRMLKNDNSIADAYEDMKTIFSTGMPRRELDPTTLQDCLEFCKSKINIDIINQEDLQYTVSLMEDELKSSYGFEIEDIERAYNCYIENLEDFDSIFQAIREAKYIKDL